MLLLLGISHRSSYGVRARDVFPLYVKVVYLIVHWTVLTHRQFPVLQVLKPNSPSQVSLFKVKHPVCVTYCLTRRQRIPSHREIISASSSLLKTHRQGHCFLIGCTTEFLVADVLPDVVKSWVDGLRIPFRDIGVPLNHVWNLPAALQMHKATQSDLRVSILRTIRPSPWSFVIFSFTFLVTIRNGKYIFYLFFPFNCEFL